MAKTRRGRRQPPRTRRQKKRRQTRAKKQRGGSFLNNTRAIPKEAYMTEMLSEDSMAPVLIRKDEYELEREAV